MDRNFNAMQIVVVIVQSLSARRAWIEIRESQSHFASSLSLSARRAWIEMHVRGYSQCPYRSLSARRAWIEILESKQIDPSVMQSLSARRAWIEIVNEVWANFSGFCRSPQGERG